MRLSCGISLGLAALGTLAHTQTSPADALRAPAKTLKTTDLPDTVRAVVLGANDGMGGMSPYVFMGMGSSNEDPRSTLFLQLMGTTFVDPDEFAALLEGKGTRIRGYTLDVAAMMASAPRNSSGPPEPTFTETWIEAGRVVQWSPRPGLTKASILAVYAGPKVASPAVKAQGLSNAKQVALAVIMYSGDYDDAYPLADSTAKAQTAVYPYLKNNDLWTSPNPQGGRLLYNTSLSRTSQTALEAPAETPMIWDEKPWPDGGRVVGYADGHVRYATQEDWERVVWPFELRRRGNRTGGARLVPKPR